MTNVNRSFYEKRFSYAAGIGLVTLLAGGMAAALMFDPLEKISLFALTPSQRLIHELSIGAVCAVLTFVITFAVSTIGYRLFTREREDISEIERITEQGRYDWVGRLTVAFTLTAVLTSACVVAFFIIANMFREARIDVFTSIFVCALYAGILGFGVAHQITIYNERSLLILVAVVVILGLSASFLIAQEPLWWQNSISFLGHDPNSGILFNVTIISVGLITLALVRDLIMDLELLEKADKFPPRGLQILRFTLTGIAIGIIGVGLFPASITRLSATLHNLSAHGITILFILLMLGLRWIAPNIYQLLFLNVSFGLGVLCLLALGAYFIIGFINFVVLELILFSTFGVWVYLFKTNTIHYIRQQDPEAIKRAFSAP